MLINIWFLEYWLFLSITCARAYAKMLEKDGMKKGQHHLSPNWFCYDVSIHHTCIPNYWTFSKVSMRLEHKQFRSGAIKQKYLFRHSSFSVTTLRSSHAMLASSLPRAPLSTCVSHSEFTCACARLQVDSTRFSACQLFCIFRQFLLFSSSLLSHTRWVVTCRL